MTDFNGFANPKIETKRFKIYADVASSSQSSPVWELQGRGVESWTVEENQDVKKTVDVLGFIDLERGISQPAQSGVSVKLRKDSKLAALLFDAWFKRDMSLLDGMKILQKFEFADAGEDGYCLARLEEDVLIAVNSFNGEASGCLSFDVDIHYANKSVFGRMAKDDADPVVFTPDN